MKPCIITASPWLTVRDLGKTPMARAHPGIPIGVGAIVAWRRPVQADYAARLYGQSPSANVAADPRAVAADLLAANDQVELATVLEKHFPEMRLLAAAADGTPEGMLGKADDTQFVSYRMHGQRFAEYDRAVCLMWAALAAIRNDHTAIAHGHTVPAIMLTAEDTQRLHDRTIAILGVDPEGTLAVDPMRLYTFTLLNVIHDHGKLASVKDRAAALAISTSDHDQLLFEVVSREPGIFPSLNSLHDPYFSQVMHALYGLADFNLGQYLQGENTPAFLRRLETLDRDTIELMMLHALFDITGAHGHLHADKINLMIRPIVNGYHAARENIFAAMGPDSRIDAVGAFHNQTKSMVEPLGIDTSTDRGLTLGKLAQMLRARNSEQANVIVEEFDKLSSATQVILIKALHANGVTDRRWSIRLYYGPAVAANLEAQLKDQGDQHAFRTATRLAMQAYARIYQLAYIDLRKRPEGGAYTVYVEDLAKFAKGPIRIDHVDFDLVPVHERMSNLRITPHPLIDAAQFPQITDLANAIPETVVVPIGMGGGSDALQAAQWGLRLRAAGKTIPAVISIRTSITGSPSNAGEVGERRIVTYADGADHSLTEGVYPFFPDTKSTGRVVEHLPADDVDMYLVLYDRDDAVPMADQAAQIRERIQVVLKAIEQKHGITVDALNLVDTGGDALHPIAAAEGQEIAKSTPDQDLTVGLAMASGFAQQVLTVEIAAGVDAPPNAQEVLMRAGARYYRPTDQDKAAIGAKYTVWGTPGKTPKAWQRAMAGERGYRALDLPTQWVTDDRRPWDPFVFVDGGPEGSMEVVFVMDHAQYLAAIGCTPPTAP